MSLVSAILGFVLRKAGLLVVMVLTMFLTYLFVQTAVPALDQAAANRDRLVEVAQERAELESELQELKDATAQEELRAIESLRTKVETEIAQTRGRVAEQQAEIERLVAEQDNACGFVREVISWILPGNACKAAEAAVEKANAALATLEAGLSAAQSDAAILTDSSLTASEKLSRLGEGRELTVVERQIQATEAELRQKNAEEASLEESQSTGAGWLLGHWDRSWKWLLAIAAIILVLPVALRILNYWVLMPLLYRAHTPMRLSPDPGPDPDPDPAPVPDAPETSTPSTPTIHISEAQRTLPILLSAGEVLSARSEHVRPVQGKVRSQVLYDWSAPFISFAAGLFDLSRVTGDEDGTATELSTPENPHDYLMRIDFTDHPGIVMRPRHVVGVIGAPRLETRWRFGIPSLAAGQIRYIMFAGTGNLIIQGSGDVKATNPRARATRMDQHLVMGFDSRLRVGVNRRETFLPYLKGKAPLVDYEFNGEQPLFWQKSTTAGPRNPIAKGFNAVFSALGKILGF